MTSFDTPLISFSGLASGLNTSAIIESLLNVERVPITIMMAKQEGFQDKISKFTSLKTKLEALQSAAEDLKDSDGFQVFSTETSLSGILTASTSVSTSPGTYQIEVYSLATFEQEATSNFADKNTTSFGSGTLTITVGETVTEIAVDPESATLEDIAEAINESGAEVTASVIHDGTDTPYRLVLTGNNTGADETIVVDASGLSGGEAELSFSELQSAADAHFKINNIEMYRSTNSVESAIAGLTLELTGTTEVDEPLTLTVSRDTEAIKEKIETLVDAYNGVVQFINQQNTYNTKTEEGGTLMGESILRRLQQGLSSNLLPVWNFGEEAPELQLLSQIGISLENDGTFKIEGSELEEAIDGNYEDVLAMFSKDGIGDLVDDFLEEYTKFNGFVDNAKTSAQKNIDDLDDQIAKAEERLDLYEKILVNKFAALEELMSGLQSQMAFLNAGK